MSAPHLEGGMVRLCKLVEDDLGLAPGLVSLEVVKRVLKEEGLHSHQALLARILAPDEELIRNVGRKVTVRETYFFRHPEHFEFLADWLQHSAPRLEGRVLRAWSAGCSTGEESYSMAATLLAAGVRSEVLGTDVDPARLAHAREGRYASALPRPGSRLLQPIFETSGPGPARVREALRQITTFQHHSLATDAPAGPFDLIFCRNVFIYFNADFIRAACERLASALAPEGLLVLGTVETCELPPWMRKVGASGLQMFTRSEAPPAVPPEPMPPPTRSAPRWDRAPTSPVVLRPPSSSKEAVEAHLRALGAIDAHDTHGAHAQLVELTRRFPAYLPGLLEQALLLDRQGARAGAAALMNQLIRRAEGLASGTLIEGPMSLPVEYFLSTARTWLASKARR